MQYRIDILNEGRTVTWSKAIEGTEQEAMAEAVRLTDSRPPIIQVIRVDTNDLVKEFRRRY